ncbi:MAG: GAF domain-containing protein, partial [Fidelibacterota bacterium]
MSPPKRLTSVSFTSLLGTLLASAILFVLFVYPNPGGSVFSFLRLVVIVAVGYLFYHFYSGGDSREKAPLFGEGSRADPSQKGTRVKVVEMEQEAEKEFDRSSRSILELFVSGNPQFSAAVFLADRTGSQLARRVFTGETNAFRDRLSLENTAVGGLLTVDHVRFITPNDDEELFSTLFEDVAKLPPSTTVLVAPIAVDGSPRGVVLIHAGQFSDFDEHHRDLAASYSDLMGRNLKQLESLSSIRSDIRFFAHLDAFQSELEIVRSQDEMLSSFARFCGVNFDFDKLTVSTVDEARSGEAAVRVVSGFTLDVAGNESFSLSDSHHGRVISQGEPLRIDNLLEEPGIAGRFTAGDLEEHKFLSFLGVPIKYKKDVLGSLVLESFESNKYSDSDLKLLGVVGERAGTLLDWWRKYGVVREAARRDGLTGLLNHLSFMERFKEEISRANRYQESLVLLILDLDKFKFVN